MSFKPNQEFGPYVLIDQIAVGGMAEIYLAKTTSEVADFEKVLALKVIHPDYAHDEQFIQMLIDEAKISVGLNHANIGQIFDLGRYGETYYISMEFIDGFDLFKILRRLSELGISVPFDVATFIAQEVSTGLDYAHRKRDGSGRALNIIHRDISPQNILVSRAGEIKIVDFGIAKAASRTRQTQAGVIKGKYFYMSPEQAWGDRVDQRSDIFSAGIILYEVLTGQMLYLEEDMHKLIDMVRKADIPRPTRKRPDIPPQLESIVMKALAKRPADRWQSAHDLQSALTSFLYSYASDFTPDRVSELVNEAMQSAPKGATIETGLEEVESLLLRDDVPIDQHSMIFDVRDLSEDTSLATEDRGESTRITGPPSMLGAPLLTGPPSMLGAPLPPAAGLSGLGTDELDDEQTLVARSKGGHRPKPPVEIVIPAPLKQGARPPAEEDAVTSRPELVSRQVGGQPMASTSSKPMPNWPSLPSSVRRHRPTGPLPPPAPALREVAKPASAEDSTSLPKTEDVPRSAPDELNPADFDDGDTLLSDDPIGLAEAPVFEFPEAIVNPADLEEVHAATLPPEPFTPGTVPSPLEPDSPLADAASMAKVAPATTAPTGPYMPAPTAPADPGPTPSPAGSGSPGATPPTGPFAPVSLPPHVYPMGQPQPLPQAPPLPSNWPQAAMAQPMAQPMPQPDEPQLRRHGSWLVVVLLIALVALVGGVAAMVWWPVDRSQPSLTVHSVPAGATVWVNGLPAPKKTPVVVPVEMDKSIMVRVSLKHHEIYQQTIRLSGDERQMKVIAVLTSMTGRVDVDSSPRGADIYLNKDFRGTTPFVLRNLKLNEDTVFELRKRGYKSVTTAVKWEGLTYRKVKVTLQRSR